MIFKNVCYSITKTEKKVVIQKIIAKNSMCLTKYSRFAPQNIHFQLSPILRNNSFPMISKISNKMIFKILEVRELKLEKYIFKNEF